MPSAETGAVPGETLGHRYVLRREFGRGGMATVFLAQDLRLGKDVAIKFPRPDLFERPESRERFEREVRSLTQLDHRAIVKILDVGEHGDRPFVVMQYLAGGTLAERLQDKDRKLPAPIALVGWITEIASALDFTHAQNYLHRDVKPSNVLFDAAGNAYLSDFGIARAIGADTQPPSNWGSSPGTPLYMAPEITDDVPLGPAYDQYALGVVVYQVLTGRIPHQAESGLGLMVKRATEPPRTLRALRPELPDGLEDVVMRALARSPADRFPNCRAFAEAFRRACSMAPRAEPLPSAAELPAPDVVAAEAPIPEVVALAPAPAPIVASPAPWEPLAPTPSSEVTSPKAETETKPTTESETKTKTIPTPVVAPRFATRHRTTLVRLGAAALLVALTTWAAWPRKDQAKKDDGSPRAAAPEVRAKEPAPSKSPNPASLANPAATKVRGYPPLPARAPGVDGYERARAFLLAKSEWEQSLGATRDAVLAAPELAAWNAGAADLATFVKDADALTLALDERGPLVTERHRATVHGALTPDRPDLLRIEVSDGRAPAVAPLSGGRFAAEFELGFDVASEQVKFTRLDGTLLAALEIRVPDVSPPTTPPTTADHGAPAPATHPSEPAPAPAPPAKSAAPVLAGFRRTDEKAGDHPIWIHEKSGLRFVELRIPESIERSLPHLAANANAEAAAASADATRPLLVSETECTVAAWKRWRSADVPADAADDLPVSNVAGADIVAFCAAMGLELPYAAEWRWFALADGADAAENAVALVVSAWFKSNADGDLHAVRSLTPNGFGLYDVEGNVWELCLGDGEAWSSAAGRSDAPSTVRPYLGGSCTSSAERCRIAKGELARDGAGATRGFRPIFRPPGSR